MTKFQTYNENEITNIHAGYWPSGKNYSNKNIPNTNIRKFITGVSLEYGRLHQLLNDISIEYDINNSTQLLPLWESALGIPDGCFPGSSLDEYTIEQRRRDCIVKLTMDSVVTEQDFKDLALLYGFQIEILQDPTGNLFPVSFPWEFDGSTKEGKFTMIVFFVNVPPQPTFPAEFPMMFGGGDQTNIIQCVFRKLVPANVKLVFQYNPDA